MGDLIRLTTLAGEQNIIYKVPTDGLKFSVKGRNCAAIAILSKPDSSSAAFWVGLADAQRLGDTFIKTSSEQKVAQTPHILSPDEFRSFWISWTSSAISVGREGEDQCIVSCPWDNRDSLSYATFFVNSREPTPLEWEFELAPEIPRPVEKHIDGGKVEWVRWNGGQVPWNAVIGGFENETLYIIRALHSGSLAVGKFVPSRGSGFVAWGSRVYKKDGAELEFLVGYDCRWVQTSGSRIPVGAVIGGYTEHYHRENIYVGRAWCGKRLLPGKVHKMYEQCYTPYGYCQGKEVGHTNYEILVSSDIDKRGLDRRPQLDLPSGSDNDNDDDDDEGPYIF